MEMNRVLTGRNERPLDEFEAAACHACYAATREHATSEIQAEQRTFALLVRDMRAGRVRVDADTIWGNVRVRAVLAGGFGDQLKEIVHAFLRRRAEAKTDAGATELD